MTFRFIFVGLALLFLGGCQKKTTSHRKDIPEHQRYLNISFHTDLQSLDPRKGIDFPTFFVMKMLFEGLTHVGSDGNIRPGIAKSWDVSEDQKTYTFHLRPSAWSNGDKVTAYDFEYSWKKMLDPKDPSLGIQSFFPVKNAHAISLGQKPLESAGFKAIDAYTIEVELEYPTPYFLELVSTPPYFAISQGVDQLGHEWMKETGDGFVCNGPFKLEKLHYTDEILVIKNPSYWEADQVKLPGIRIAIIKDMTTQMNLFEKGELHWLGNPLSKFHLDATKHMKHTNQLKYMPTLSVYWYFVNTEAFPFQNKKMRQAFAYAVNRKLLSETILEGADPPATAVLPYSLATQEDPFFQDNNLALAQQLFQEALDEMEISREDLPSITLNYVSTDPEYVRVAEATQQQWNTAFGIDVHLEHQDWRGHYSKLQSGSFQLGGMGWQTWIRDSIYILQTFQKKDLGINMSRWENAQFQELLAKAEVEADLARRKQLYNEAEAILMEEMPVIPIYFMTSKYAQSNKLKNVFLSDLYEADFRWAYLEE